MLLRETLMPQFGESVILVLIIQLRREDLAYGLLLGIRRWNP
jgi:hypothetical protein